MSRPSTRPPQWLMCILMLCLSALLAAWLAHPAGPLTIRAMPEVPTPTAAPPPPPAPSPTPEPAPVPDYSLPVPAGEAVAAEWFDDAVFIGDSRTDGLHLFSGVSAKAVFLESTGLTVYEVMEGKEVIRLGREKVSVLDALTQNTAARSISPLGSTNWATTTPTTSPGSTALLSTPSGNASPTPGFTFNPLSRSTPPNAKPTMCPTM